MLSAPRLAAALIAAISAAVLGSVVAARAQDEIPVGTGKGVFGVPCAFSHSSHDDPIVFPGQLGASHRHDFVGNRSTDAHSTNDSLRDHLTTCVRGFERKEHLIPLNRTAYWIPSFIEAGEPVAPQNVEVRYQTGFRERNIVPFPPDFRMVAGDAKGGPSKGVFSWRCIGDTLEPGTDTHPPTCAESRLVFTLSFQDCWDGANSDSADHRSHVAYSSRNAAGYDSCPDSHPVQIPTIRAEFGYPSDGGPDARLSSGDMSTSHGDFMNGWDPEHLAFLVEECLNADVYCGNSGGPHPRKN